MKKILFTASTFSHIRQFHLPYLQAFQEQGWEVHVAAGGARTPLPYADHALSVPFRKRMLAPENLKAASMLRRAIAEENYDLLAVNTSLAAFFTRLAVDAKRRPKVVNMVHGYLFDNKTAPAKRALLLSAERGMASRTDLVLTMNRYDYAVARKYRLGGQIGQIPGVGADFFFLDQTPPEAGMALRAEYGISEDAFVLLYAAEFSARKSQKVLIRAMERLPDSAVLVLAGDGALREECRRLASPLGRRVLFPGYVREMGPLYRMADAAVSASRSEGLPFNIMEAMYAGLPVVASRVKGHMDLITHGETGLLYPYGDAEKCAECILMLMRSPEKRARLGERAREAVKPYALEAVFPLVWAQFARLAGI